MTFHNIKANLLSSKRIDFELKNKLKMLEKQIKNRRKIIYFSIIAVR